MSSVAPVVSSQTAISPADELRVRSYNRSRARVLEQCKSLPESVAEPEDYFAWAKAFVEVWVRLRFVSKPGCDVLTFVSARVASRTSLVRRTSTSHKTPRSRRVLTRLVKSSTLRNTKAGSTGRSCSCLDATRLRKRRRRTRRWRRERRRGSRS
jgi:hypothetical protein